MCSSESSRRERWLLVTIFALALAYHLYAVTYHWTMGFMSGHEFRQAQTAITTYYIDEQNNFSLRYETPILGKPWVGLLLEVPVYEWSVVLFSRATGLSHLVAARLVSTACFYLMLPAVYLLLGRLAVPKPRRLLLLALVLSAPVYIYYSRAFLMDSMALMCSAWFLLGFVRTMDERRWSWLALTIVVGSAAALIKSATLAVWLLPAAAYGAWMLWRDLRAGTGWMAPLKTLLWGLATVAVALGALRCWIACTDPIKAAHASAFIFTSKNLSQGNWGLFDFRPLFSTELWRRLLGCWEQAIMSRWLIALGLMAGLAFPAVRWRVLGTSSVFFLAQFLFPHAYADQDYYFYSCAVFLHVALGFTLLALLDSRIPRWGAALVCLVPFAAQGIAYQQDYWKGQSTVFQGDLPFTQVLRELTPKDTVIIVAGADWAAMTPLYAQRKALMIRSGLEFDRNYLHRAYEGLADEKVCALILQDRARQDSNFITMTAPRFEMDASGPTFSSASVDVYVARPYVKAVLEGLKNRERYTELTVRQVPPEDVEAKDVVAVSPEVARETFASITPAPIQMKFQHGAGRQGFGDRTVILAHTNSDLWLKPPAMATRIEWSYGIFPAAYERAEGHTDGVEFIIEGELPGAPSRRIYRRVLDPWQVAGDRGDQHAVIPYHPRPGETLRFSTRPYENSAYDWAYFVEIGVR